MARDRSLASVSIAALLGGGIMFTTFGADAADVRHFSFGYDQPHTTGYGIAGDMFNAKLGDYWTTSLFGRRDLDAAGAGRPG